MGSIEVYPIDGKLNIGMRNKTILTIKLRLLGGVKDTLSQN